MSDIRLRASVILLLGAALTHAPIEPSRLYAASQATAGSLSIADRLSRVRDDVFTRPERREASIRELHGILAEDPRIAEAHVLLGLAYAGLNTQEMRAEAVAEFRQALEIEPQFTPARFYLARVYLDLGQIDRAREELLTTVAAAPGQPQFMALLSDAERRLSNPTRAVEVARAALAINPAFVQARYYLALALFDLGQQEDAVRELEQVAKSAPPIADVYFSLGTAYRRSGRIDEAITALTHGATIGPTPPDARIELARAYRVKGLLTRAQAQLDLALPPGSAMQASAQYQKIEADILVEQGLIRVAQGRLEAARTAFVQALDLAPNHGPAHRHLAEWYLARKLFAKANEHAALAATFGEPVPEATRAALDRALPTATKGTSQ